MKKLIVKMMTGFCMLGVVAVLDAPITAYAFECQGEIVSTGETWNYTSTEDGSLTAEQQAQAAARMAGWGDASTPAPSTSNSTAGASNNTQTSSSSTSTKKSTPSYTKEQIDAAWVEDGRTEATCAAEGQISYKNTITGDTKVESIPATGVHTYEATGHVDATCVAEGHDTCSVCGETVTIPATGHTVGNTVVTKKAGLFSTGTKTTYCANCEEVMATEAIPQTCPFSLVQVITFVIAFGALVAVTVGFILKKRTSVKAVA